MADDTIESVDAAVYTVPTDAPEGDGTLTWDSTIMTVVQARAGGTCGGSQTDTRVENFTATNQLETLTATIDCNRHCLKIRRQGGYGVDLTGNTVIKVDMTLCDALDEAGAPCAEPSHQTVLSVASYKNGAKWLAPDDVVVSVKRYTVPPTNYTQAMKEKIADIGIPAHVTMTYTIRHVADGDSTYEEKDDAVEEITRSFPDTGKPALTNLIPVRDTVMPLYALYDQQGYILNLDPPGGRPSSACFASYGEANDFLSYLRIKGAKKALASVGGAKLTINGRTPSLDETRGLVVDTGC